MKKENEELVFGDFLEFFDKFFPESDLNEISSLYNGLVVLKTKLLEAFITFTISNKGFNHEDYAHIGSMEDFCKGYNSMEAFDKDKWVEELSHFPLQGPYFQPLKFRRGAGDKGERQALHLNESAVRTHWRKTPRGEV